MKIKRKIMATVLSLSLMVSYGITSTVFADETTPKEMEQPVSVDGGTTSEQVTDNGKVITKYSFDEELEYNDCKVKIETRDHVKHGKYLLPNGYNITVTIKEDASDNITIPVSVFDIFNEFVYMPGDTASYTLRFVNNSAYTFQYIDNSLTTVLTTGNLSDGIVDRNFYDKLLGASVTTNLTGKESSYAESAGALADKTSSYYSQVNALYNQGIGTLASNGSWTSDLYVALSGPGITNTYANKNFGGYVYLEMNKVIPKTYTTTVNFLNEETGEKIQESIVSEAIEEGTAYDLSEYAEYKIGGYQYIRKDGDDFTGNLDGNKVINLYYSVSETGGSEDPGDNNNTDPKNPSTPDNPSDEPVVSGGEDHPDNNMATEPLETVEKTSKDIKSSKPNTGDANEVLIWTLAALFATISLGGMLAYKKKAK